MTAPLAWPLVLTYFIALGVALWAVVVLSEHRRRARQRRLLLAPLAESMRGIGVAFAGLTPAFRQLIEAAVAFERAYQAAERRDIPREET